MADLSLSNIKGRILSIQSHVSYGYVGGKAAVFALQCLGYDVDVVNTVNYSNHAGYGRSGGSKTSAAELTSIFNGMWQNELLVSDRLLTGYAPNAEGLSAIMQLVKDLKKANPELIYLLDPVMGDAGRLYVSPDVIPIYRTMLNFATIITPNWFEVETLTDVHLTDMSSLQRAFHILHTTYQVPNVVISSIPLRPWLANALPSVIRWSSLDIDATSEYLLCIASSASPAQRHDSSSSFVSTVYAQCVPLIPGYFSGVGDLFSALLLGHYLPVNSKTPSPSPDQSPIAHATSRALTLTHEVLRRTNHAALSLPEDERQPSDDELDKLNPLRRTKRMRGRELRLIQSQDIIRGAVPIGSRRMEIWDGFWIL